MATNLGTFPYEPQSYHRNVVRKSNGDIVVTAYDWYSSEGQEHAPEFWISADNGSTWTHYNPDEASYGWSGDNDENYVGCAIDGNDGIHVAFTDSNDADINWTKWSVSTSSLTNDTHELITTSHGAEIYRTDMAVDSAGTVWLLEQPWPKLQGTNYYHIYLHERTGAGSWSETAVATGQTNHADPSLAIDTNDDVHIVWNEGGQAAHQKYDTSAGTLGTRTNPTTAVPTGGLYIDPSTNEAVFPAADGSLYKGDSSGWTSDSYTTETVTASTIAHGADGNLYVVWENGNTTIRENHNTFGNFATGDATTVASGGTYTEPSTRWQQNYENDPGSDVIDVQFYDSGNTDMYYAQLDASPSGITITVTLNGTAVDAYVYVIDDTNNTIDTATNTGSDGQLTVTPADSSATFHVAVEYTDANGNQYYAVSEPFVQNGASLSFALESYTPPDPDTDSVNFDLT